MCNQTGTTDSNHSSLQVAAERTEHVRADFVPWLTADYMPGHHCVIQPTNYLFTGSNIQPAPVMEQPRVDGGGPRNLTVQYFHARRHLRPASGGAMAVQRGI